MKELTARDRAQLILFSGYDFDNFITLTDRRTGEKTYVIIGR